MASAATCFICAAYFGWSSLRARRRRLIEAAEHEAFESPVAVESMPSPN
jgi:hypothetical protein